MKKLNKYLLLFNLFFLQSYLIRFDIGGYPSNLQEILIGLQIICFLPFLKFKNIKKYWLINSLIALSLFSIIINSYIDFTDLARHIKFLFFGSVLAFIFLETFKTNKEREKGLKTLGLGAITFGIFSLIYNLLGYNIAHDLRLLGPLDAAVYIAYYLSPFFIYFSIKSFKNKENLKYAIALALLIIATKSMGAIGANFIILILYFFKQSNFKISKTHKIAVVALSIIVLGTIFYSKILPTLQTEYSSLDERGEIWITSIEFLKDPSSALTGLGYGQFQAHYFENVKEILGKEPLDYYVLQPHNIFLLFCFHYGILGLALILFCIWKTLKIIHKNPQNILAFIALYFFIHGLIDTPIFKNDLLFLFILILELTFHFKPAAKSSKVA